MMFYRSQQTWGSPWQGVLRVVRDAVRHGPFEPVQMMNLTCLLIGLSLTCVVYRHACVLRVGGLKFQWSFNLPLPMESMIQLIAIIGSSPLHQRGLG